MYCTQCGSEVQQDARFCTSCGAAHPPEQRLTHRRIRSRTLYIGIAISVVALALITGIYLSLHTRPQGGTLGLSYDEVMRSLATIFPGMQAGSPVDGRDHYAGFSTDRRALLEIIGDKRDVSEAILTVGSPKGETDEQKQQMVALMLSFLKNVTPEWGESGEWLAVSLKGFAASPEKTAATVKGNKLLRLEDATDTKGWYVLSVKPNP